MAFQPKYATVPLLPHLPTSDYRMNRLLALAHMIIGDVTILKSCAGWINEIYNKS